MKRLLKTHLLSILVVLTFLIIAFGSEENKSSNTNSDGTTKTPRQIEIEKQFSSWDGSHRNLEKLIKQNMNDPDSYEHVETKYWDMDDHLVVMTTFRGKNAFGGVVKNFIKAKVDMNGNIIEVIDQGQ